MTYPKKLATIKRKIEDLWFKEDKIFLKDVDPIDLNNYESLINENF
jgi:hypothetical protein